MTILVCRWRRVSERERRWPLEAEHSPQLTASKDMRPQNYHPGELSSASGTFRSLQIKAPPAWHHDFGFVSPSSVCPTAELQNWAYQTSLILSSRVGGNLLHSKVNRIHEAWTQISSVPYRKLKFWDFVLSSCIFFFLFLKNQLIFSFSNTWNNLNYITQEDFPPLCRNIHF